MNFISAQYLIFLLAAVTVYYLLPQPARRYWLLAANLVFYASFAPQGLFILAFTALASWVTGMLLEKEKAPGRRKGILAAGLALVFACLFLYKYLGFFSGFFPGGPVSFRLFDLVLPIGLSFFTLSAAGYCIDVYREKIAAEHEIVPYALFVSFFPLLLSGPIERAGHMLPQFKEKHKLSYENIKAGLFTILWGYFVKMVIADRLAIFRDSMLTGYAAANGLTAFVSVFAYCFQIYTDFHGCSLIAMGSAQLFGFDVMENFRSPWLAGSCRETWSRWHISFSTWLRDYIYIPLGGSRKGRARKYLNTLITSIASGMWHGAGLIYLIWGGLNALYQIAEDALGALIKRPLPRALKPFKTLLTFTLISVAFIFFGTDNFDFCRTVLAGFFHPDGSLTALLSQSGLDRADWIVLLAAVLLLLAVDILTRNTGFRAGVLSAPRWAYPLIWVTLVTAVLLFGIYGPGYSAQDFIYAQF